jgi:hypothetical protein
MGGRVLHSTLKMKLKRYPFRNFLNVSEVVSNDHEIQMCSHCGLCFEEWKQAQLPGHEDQESAGISMRDYARLEVGFTRLGVQIWCLRHGMNVINIDFQGAVHPANTSGKRN